MKIAYIIRYNEIGLKGKNRSYFEDLLVRNIKYAIKDLGKPNIIKTRGRILIYDLDDADPEAIADKLKNVAGIHGFSKGERLEPNIELWKEKCIELFKESWNGIDSVNFRVTTVRSDKNFPQSSNQLNTLLGAHIAQYFDSEKLTVSLKQPDIDIGLEINTDGSILYSKRTKGLGGLPVGSAGRVLCLLSGGLDSPVAAFNMMRRGCIVNYIFFENRVFLGRAAYDKVFRLAQLLGKFQSKVRLYVVPFSDIQVAIRDKCNPKNRVVLYRRYMYRIAEKVMLQNKMLGLVTGENLGQVASQTLENLQSVNTVVNTIVYRPLISYDKQDIVDISKKIGTYETSIEDAPDCCSVFMPKRPAIRTVIENLIEDESKFDGETLENEAIENMETLVIE